MKKAWLVVLAGMAIMVGASFLISGGEAGGSSSREGATAKAKLRAATGDVVGSVRLKQQGDVVRVNVEVDGSVSAGFHGFHIHTTGLCVAPFTSAGGHYNVVAGSHPDHTGDLPSLYIDADGEGEANIATDRFALRDLFDADGSAFILHAGRDNFANIPTDRYDPDADATTLATGDAGSRFACGVIEGKGR